ncbi:hypothetical protein [Lysobacter gummosus]|uniref:hypothetical protein n=1 Tax=Lysobacter gummosus TaxID=262324 RepID=UPI003629F359
MSMVRDGTLPHAGPPPPSVGIASANVPPAAFAPLPCCKCETLRIRKIVMPLRHVD